ncbi:MAG: hypothetical protein HC855_12775 [Rhizobiales bacterium]|nr:hypothetical protein [Hyphomicrobiales bacterium]
MNRRLVYLLATMAVLGGYAAWSQGGALTALVSPAKQQAAAAVKTLPAAKSNPPAALNPLDGLDERAVAAIVERPLFSQSRRPPAPPPDPVPPPGEAPEVVPAPQGPVLSAEDFTLLAVSSAGQHKVAVIRVNGSNEVFYLREDQPLLDWRVLNVGTRDVKIGNDEAHVTITMFDKPRAAAMPGDTTQSAEAAEQLIPDDPVVNPATTKPKGTVFHPDAGKTMKPPGAIPQNEGGG